jgi:hypothetical protein
LRVKVPTADSKRFIEPAQNYGIYFWNTTLDKDRYFEHGKE